MSSNIAQVHQLAVVHLGGLHDGVGIVHFAKKHILWLFIYHANLVP